MSLLDCADHTPELSKKYEAIQKRFSARLPIMQLVMRRQKIEYKLKKIQKIVSSDQPQGNEEMTRAEAVTAKPVLLSELNELRNSIESMVRDYESTYGERFERARAGNQGDMPFSPPAKGHPQMSPSPPKQRFTPTQQHQSGSGNQRNTSQQPRRTPPSHHKPQTHTNRF